MNPLNSLQIGSTQVKYQLRQVCAVQNDIFTIMTIVFTCPQTLALCDIRVLEKTQKCHFSYFLIGFWKCKHHHQLRNTPGNLWNTKSHFPPEMEIRGFERIATTFHILMFILLCHNNYYYSDVSRPDDAQLNLIITSGGYIYIYIFGGAQRGQDFFLHGVRLSKSHQF